MKLFTRVLLGAYTLFVAAVVFWPTPVDRPVAGTVQQVVTDVQQAGATGFTYSTVEMSTNVLMFVPLGLLIVVVMAQQGWGSRRTSVPWLAGASAIVACIALSTTIELVQRVYLPDRVSSVVDVAANTAGAIIGAALASAILWWSRRRNGVVTVKARIPIAR